ncbi:MAG: BtrH N-terminal domain-containing protein [Edaphocola sp.]
MQDYIATPPHTTFGHKQHAHCESGVTANLLRHAGIAISEPMAFGIGAGIFFGHLPFVKVSGIPGTTFRIWPGYIFKRVCQRLGVGTKAQKFGNRAAAAQALDEALAQGVPVGMMAGVYYLDYLPEAFRFHFNAHNLIVYGKDKEGQYLVSDPVLEATSTIGSEALLDARFAKGFPEPKGRMYYITRVPEKVDFTKGIMDGIKQTCFFMTSPPVSWFGVNGIYLLAKKIAQYPAKLSPRQAALYLGNIIRMQEEIGTGGGGFRFLYAAFLQEAAKYLQNEALAEFSKRYTAIGDQWRHFAYSTARICKARNSDLVSFRELAKLLADIADKEKAFFADLKKWAKNHRA